MIDEDYARDQYRRARHELSRSICGFGFAREWPLSAEGTPDIDSGPIIPLLGVSAGSSGLALVAAAAFGDDDFLEGLWTTLHFAAFPDQRDGALQFSASNQVGDAVLLYAAVLGPLWEEVHRRKKP